MKEDRESANHARSNHHKAVQALESEMKLLQWHKLANESALQTALMRTKAIRKEEARMRPLIDEARRTKKKERLRRAKEEEEAKPILELEYGIKARFKREEIRHTAADMKRRECRANLLLESKKMIEERAKLKSRKDYSKHMRSINNDGTGKIVKCIPSEAENFNGIVEDFKEIQKRFDGVAKSFKRDIKEL